jgi:hypothetical protein
MPVPKTPMNKDYRVPRSQYDVGTAGEGLDVETITATKFAQQSPHNEFRAGTLDPDTRHQVASLLRREANLLQRSLEGLRSNRRGS